MNKAAIPLLILTILLNEIFLRGRLTQYEATPEELWSFIVLTLNARMPYEQGLVLHATLTSLVLFYFVVLFRLPMWGLRPVKRGLQSGLPDYRSYGNSYFFIDSKFQKVAFWLWHSVLMKVSLFLIIFLFSVIFNVFRNKLF